MVLWSAREKCGAQATWRLRDIWLKSPTQHRTGAGQWHPGTIQADRWQASIGSLTAGYKYVIIIKTKPCVSFVIWPYGLIFANDKSAPDQQQDSLKALLAEAFYLR